VEQSVEEGLEGAHRVMHDLANVGIDFNCVTWQLENEGVQKFIDPFAELMKALGEKRHGLTP
jgi:hypothetical protein